MCKPLEGVATKQWNKVVWCQWDMWWISLPGLSVHQVHPFIYQEIIDSTLVSPLPCIHRIVEPNHKLSVIRKHMQHILQNGMSECNKLTPPTMVRSSLLKCKWCWCFLAVCRCSSFMYIPFPLWQNLFMWITPRILLKLWITYRFILEQWLWNFYSTTL